MHPGRQNPSAHSDVGLIEPLEVAVSEDQVTIDPVSLKHYFLGLVVTSFTLKKWEVSPQKGF